MRKRFFHTSALSSEFEVIAGLKSDNDLKTLVVHHYRLANPDQRIMNAPWLASFEPKESSRYLLFLQRESDGRYAPFNQTDPAWTSILRLSGTEWDGMTSDNFKTGWMPSESQEFKSFTKLFIVGPFHEREGFKLPSVPACLKTRRLRHEPWNGFFSPFETARIEDRLDHTWLHGKLF